MSEESSIQVNTRIPVGILEYIDELVEKKKFRSRGDFVVSAVRHYMEHLKELERYQVYKFYLREGDENSDRRSPGSDR